MKFENEVNTILSKQKFNFPGEIFEKTSKHFFSGSDGSRRHIRRLSRWKEIIKTPRDHLGREARQTEQWTNAGTQNRKCK